MKYRSIVLAAAILLAGCKGRDESADNERKTAAGEVLGGSISDAMLPLDTVTSQSPPLRDEAAAEPAKSPAKRPKPDTQPDAKPADNSPEPAPSASATPRD